MTLHSHKQAHWGHIWKYTVEKRKASATNAILHQLGQALWMPIWKHTVEKNHTRANFVNIDISNSVQFLHDSKVIFKWQPRQWVWPNPYMCTLLKGKTHSAMACPMFQNQKVTDWLTQWVTRSPIELFRTASKEGLSLKVKDKENYIFNPPYISFNSKMKRFTC